MKRGFFRVSFAVIAVIVALSVILTGCGQPASNAGKDNASKTATYKIGMNNFGKGAYPLDIMEKTSKFANEAFGNELIAADDQFKIDKIVADIQNLISSGIQGLQFLGMVETLFPVVSKMCQDAKVPFVLMDKYPTTAEGIAALQNNPYFVGIVGSDNKAAGVAIGEFAAQQGLKKAIIVGAAQGDPTHDQRIIGFTEAFEKAGGKVIGVSRIADPSQAVKPAEDLVIANPGADCVYASGGDFATASITALEKHPDLKMKIFCTDLDPMLVDKLAAGKIEAANGGHWVSAGISAALLQNYLDGHAIKDANGKAPVYTNLPIVVLPASQVDMYKKFWIDGVPYTEEDYKNLCYRWNPKVNYDTFKDTIANYSINERLLHKAKQGQVTKEELDKYGVK